MDDTTGIPLSVDVKSLLTSYSNAIKDLNLKILLTKTKEIKINVDTTSIDSAIEKIKTDLSSISGDISGLNVKINPNDIKSQINDVLNGKTSNAEIVSEKSVKKQKTALDEITKAYMEQFNL